MDQPLVSVITPVLNARAGIDGVIRTVMEQSYPHVEHIIIDGGSEDGSVEVIKDHEKRLAYWVSEKDEGIYDAMNKGIDAAGGEWIYFLGSDDRFYNKDVLSSLFHEMPTPKTVSIIIAKVILPNGKQFKCRFNGSIIFKNTLHHQGVFYRKTVFEGYRYGMIDDNTFKHYKISGDYDLNLKLYYDGAEFIAADTVVAKCGDGISLEGRLSGYLEEILIRHRYVRTPGRIFFDMLTALRFFYKKAIRRRILV